MSEKISLTIDGLLDDMALSFPANEVLVYHERCLRYRYHGFSNQICRPVAKAFRAMGIKKGEHLSIWICSVEEEGCYASYSSH